VTQQPSQNKQIIAKLDEVIASVNAINNKVSRMETQIEMQPKIDIESHKAIDNRFDRVEERVEKIETSQIWAMRLIIGTALTAFVGIVLTLANL
jgi:tetrahydromethanopterin S-methyltransferase subunit G